MARVRDLAMRSDIFPTGCHGAVSAGVKPGSTVSIAGAGPVSLARAASAGLLGAATVIVRELNSERLEQARSFGGWTVDLREERTLPERIEQALGLPEVDSVGFDQGAAKRFVIDPHRVVA